MPWLRAASWSSSRSIIASRIVAWPNTSPTGSADAASTAHRVAAARSSTPRPARRPRARRLRLGRGGRRRRPGREGGVPRVARVVDSRARAELFFRIRELLHARRDGARRASSSASTARSLRRARRGGARPRGGRVLLRHPDAAQGRVHRAGLDRRRRLLDPPAARRRRGHHAVQLPGDGAHVDVGARARLRQHVRAEAVREGSVGVALDRRAAAGGGRARRRLQRRARATRSRSTRCSSIPTSPRSRFVGSTPIARYVYETATARGQALPGARRREEPHDRPARRRHRHGRRRRGLGRATARRASAAWPSRWSSRSAASPTPLLEAIKAAHPEGQGRRRDRAGRRRWGRSSPREHRDKVASYVERRRPKARRSSSTAAKAFRRTTASSSARR